MHPAPRIKKAPIEHENKSQKSLARTFSSSKIPINNPHQHGINNNHVPIGRSARDNRKYGLSLIGAKLSTQLPVMASAT